MPRIAPAGPPGTASGPDRGDVALCGRPALPRADHRRYLPAAGVSKGTFYGYFSSKQDLLLALLDESVGALDRVMDELDAAPLSGLERVRRFTRALLELGDDPGRSQVRADLWADILTEEEVRARFGRIERRRVRLAAGSRRAARQASWRRYRRTPWPPSSWRWGTGYCSTPGSMRLGSAGRTSGGRLTYCWPDRASRVPVQAREARTAPGSREDMTCRRRAPTMTGPPEGRATPPQTLDPTRPPDDPALRLAARQPHRLILLALVIGAGAGLGAIVFRELIRWFTLLFSGHRDYSATGQATHPFFSGAPNPHVPWLGLGFVVLAPVIGGLLYGPLIERFAREARGHGVPEVMLAVAERGGRISPAVAVVKSLASALCIGSGGSVGREGPIVQIGSALGSTLGQLVRLPESRLRLLVACGAAGGISATFNAPIAGVFFGLELILRDFQTESFSAVVLSSITAAVIGRAAFGDQAFLTLPAFHLVSLWEYLLYAGLGVLAAGVGVGFTRVLYGIEDLADRVWHGPEWARPAVGGVLLGLLLLALPQMYGVGYPVLENGIRGEYVLWVLLLLMGAKMVATSLTIAIGGSGGVFAPSLFIGAMLGTAYGQVAHGLWPTLTAPAGAYGLVGMGAVFAGAARAPITAVLIIFELTGDYTIILPLMAAIVLATGVSKGLSRDTIYTLKLRRRGIDILRGRAANLMEVLTVADAMQPIPAGVPQELGLGALIARFAEDGCEALPVVDETGAYRGTVSAQEVERAARANALDTVAGDLAVNTPPLAPQQTLERALGVLVQNEHGGLPVVAADHQRVIGWVTHRDVLRAYNARLEHSLERAARQQAAAGQAPRPAQRPIPAGAPSAPSTPGAGAGTPPRDDGADAAGLLGRLRAYRLVDLELTQERPPAGCDVKDVAWPPATLVVAIRRGAETFTPNGQTELRRGDRLTVLVPAAHAEHLVDLIGTRRAADTASVGPAAAIVAARPVNGSEPPPAPTHPSSGNERGSEQRTP